MIQSIKHSENPVPVTTARMHLRFQEASLPDSQSWFEQVPKNSAPAQPGIGQLLQSII